VAFDGGDAGQRADECLDATDEPLGWGEAGLEVDDQEGLANRRLRAIAATVGSLAAGDLCWSGWPLRGQASLLQGAGGVAAICQTPDATKPALGGLCRFRIGGPG
jgi:hypothetical protein